MDNETQEAAARGRADLITAVVLVILGLYVFYESYTMPRLEARRIHPSTIPGLVPMFLGIALTILGGVLGLDAWRKRTGSWSDFFAIFTTLEAARITAAAVLFLIFTLVLIGWVPFWAASIIFILAFILTMEIVLNPAPTPLFRCVFWGVMTAIVCGGGIYILFARIFLIRLP